MICATCFNCAPSDVVGKVVFSFVPLASAAERLVASFRLLASVWLAACASDTPESVVSRVVRALYRACDAADELNPVSCSEPPGDTATGCVEAPLPKSALPATEKNTAKVEVLIFCASM